jgi:hypothetical protein
MCVGVMSRIFLISAEMLFVIRVAQEPAVR